jgi:hypothetical protein
MITDRPHLGVEAPLGNRMAGVNGVLGRGDHAAGRQIGVSQW